MGRWLKVKVGPVRRSSSSARTWAAVGRNRKGTKLEKGVKAGGDGAPLPKGDPASTKTGGKSVCVRNAKAPTSTSCDAGGGCQYPKKLPEGEKRLEGQRCRVCRRLRPWKPTRQQEKVDLRTYTQKENGRRSAYGWGKKPRVQNRSVGRLPVMGSQVHLSNIRPKKRRFGENIQERRRT